MGSSVSCLCARPEDKVTAEQRCSRRLECCDTDEDRKGATWHGAVLTAALHTLSEFRLRPLPKGPGGLIRLPRTCWARLRASFMPGLTLRCPDGGEARTSTSSIRHRRRKTGRSEVHSARVVMHVARAPWQFSGIFVEILVWVIRPRM